MRKDVGVLLISISFGIVFWIVDTYIVHLLFYADLLSLTSYQKGLFHDVYVRSFVLIGFFLFGITVSKMAQKCQSAESELLSQLKFENLVADVSSHFIGRQSENIDAGIDLSLEKISEFTGADRSYLILFSSEPEDNDMIYQWKAEHIKNKQIFEYPGKDCPWWMEKMNSPEIIHIPDVSKLPSSANKEKKMLEKAGIMSVLSVPLQSNGDLIGFMGFDSLEKKKIWSPNYIKLMRVVGDIFTDSIEREKAEESVLKHRERLARAQEISRVGSWEVDLRTKKHFWSEEMYRLMGYTSGDIGKISIGRNTYLEHMHPDDRNIFNSCVEKALSIPGYKFDVKLRLIRKSGHIRILHSLGEVTWDSEGNQVLFQGTTQDITEMSLVEEDLQRKNRNLMILQSTALIAASSLEMEDFLVDILHEVNSYVECNCGAVYLFSAEDQDFKLCSSVGINEEFRDKINCLHPEDNLFGIIPDMQDTWITDRVDNISGCLKEFISSANIDKFVFIPVISREDIVGIILLFPEQENIISKSDLNILGNVGRQVGITVENIRLLEETRNAYEELKSLDRMKDEFVANITHELKTPLISIKGYSEVIYDGLLGELDEKQKDCMKIIVSNSERLERLIETLLNMNSLYFKKYHVLSPIHLKDVLDNATVSLVMKADDKRINIIKDYSFDMHLVYGNCEFLKYLFVYILDNAIKFSHTDSEVSISVNEDGENVFVTVTDHGIGIPECCMDRIFERFYQVDGSTTRIYGGNGLGLYLAKNIVDLHSGTIEVASEEGTGTSVKVSIPLFDPDIHGNG